MKIIRIFADKLFSFQYAEYSENELFRVLESWSDIGYVYTFLKANRQDIGDKSIEELADQIIDDASELEDRLYELSTNPAFRLEEFFKQLHNQEYQFTLLSKRKGRIHYLP